MEKNIKTKKSIWKIIGRILLILFVILIILVGVAVGAGYWYINTKLGKVNYVDIDESEIEISEGVSNKLSGYRTIALFGVDSRNAELVKGTRSDCIILVTINEKTKQVTLTSVYRDTYLEITGRNLDKVTHAYAYGGATLAMSTLNKNLDLNITEFATVNFDSVAEIINAIGGVNINVTNDELQYINRYIDETSNVTGIKSSHIIKAGTQNLDGVQAVAYGRIRYTAGGDYKRTERMRTVLTKVMDKAKKLSITQLNKLADTILPKVHTNISAGEIFSLLPQLASYTIVDSEGWPNNPKGATIGGVWYGVPVTLESKVKELHESVYGQIDYEVSDTVKEISQEIIRKTGYK